MYLQAYQHMQVGSSQQVAFIEQIAAETQRVLQILTWLEGIVHIQLQLGGMALTVCALFWPKWQQLHAILVVPLVDFRYFGFSKAKTFLVRAPLICDLL